MIAIIDYGMGNLRSVAKALESLGAQVHVTSSAKVIKTAQGVVLPGVGAMADAMKALKKEKVVDAIYNVIEADKPFLGICLGLQLLFEEGEEGGSCKGLGIFKGTVPKFNFSGLKVPHMGWNQIKKQIPDTRCPILHGVKDNAYVYFVHSYYVKPQERSIIATTTDYGIEFCSSIVKGNLFACQFHPEKSQETGVKILQNFVKLCQGDK